MKPIIILIAFFSMLNVGANAQGKKSKASAANKAAEASKPVAEPPAETKKDPPAGSENLMGDHFARKYALATRWNDEATAKDALYDLIAEYPGSDSLILALGYYYFEKGIYPSAVLICQDLLSRDPKNLDALEMAAAGYEGLNIHDRALQTYESIFLLSSNNLALYKMAFLQFQLKKYQESLTNADILLTKPEADSLKVVFNDAAGKEKEYKMKVAVLNLKGLIFKDQADKVNAKKFFEEALKEAPDFMPAKQNLTALAAAK